MKKLNSRKVSIILAIIFITGFTVSTIYARGFAERQKPHVQIVGAESRTFIWAYETEGTVYHGNWETRRGDVYEWLIDIIVPEEAYINDMGEFLMAPGWPIEVYLGGRGVRNRGIVLYRGDVSGDIRLTLGIEAGSSNPTQGDEVSVFLEFESHLLPYLIPESALHHDPFMNEYYIYFVNRRDGMWGREYYVERCNVVFYVPKSIGGLMNVFSDGGADFMRPIVSRSDKPLYDGAVVRLFG